MTRDEATMHWKDYADNLYKLMTPTENRRHDHYLTFKNQVFAMVRDDPNFIEQVVDFLLPNAKPGETREGLSEKLSLALIEEIKANTREMQALNERIAAGSKKKGLESRRHEILGRAGIVTGSVKDFGETFFEKNTYAKGGLTLLKELIDIYQGRSR